MTDRKLVPAPAGRKGVAAAAATAATAASLALALSAAPGAAPTVPEVRGRFSHAEWTAVLQRFVDEMGRVDYEALARDRAGLDAWLARLLREAFVPEKLDAQLDAAMREFVEDGRHVAVDPARRTVTLSKIFDWFEKDFLSFERQNGNRDPKIVDYVNRFRVAQPKLDRSFRVRYFDYDKRLNGR